MVEKNLLFYSNQCKYCKELAQLLNKYNITDQFITICVDDKNLKLPKIVTSVPLVIMKESNVILEGDQIFDFLNKKYKKKDLVGYNTLEMGGYSDNFSMVSESDDNIEKNVQSFDQSFANIQSNCSISTPNEDSNNYNANKNLEELLNQRSHDDNKFNNK